jgi:RNA polymerase sigma-70 factor, ECF subfamily
VPDDQQFESVLATYQDKVFRLCYAMLGDRAAAEETAQEVFVRIWKALAGYRGEAALSTWVYAITRNACLTALKSRARRRGVSLESPGVRAAVERAASGPRGPDRQPDILRFVGELPPHHRQVVLLYHLEERSYEEVALMLNLPLGTVKTWLHRARRQLAAALVEKGS